MLWYRASIEGVPPNPGHRVSVSWAHVLYMLIIYSLEGAIVAPARRVSGCSVGFHTPGYHPAVLLRLVETGDYRQLLRMAFH